MRSLVAGACCVGMLCGGAMRANAQMLGGGVVGWRTDSLLPTDDWNTFSADLRIKRSHARKNGTALGAVLPDVQYRLERSNRTGSWKTVITVLSIERSSRFSLKGAIKSPGALPLQRLEFGENGTPMRAYNAQGSPLSSYKAIATPSPSTSLPPRTIGTAWIDSFVARPVNKTLRQQAYERQYGLPTLSGTQQLYAKQDGTRIRQLVVDPANMVTLEASDVRDGVRTMRTTFRYGAAGAAGLVRLGVRSEVLVAANVDDVTIVDSSYSNIRLERR